MNKEIDAWYELKIYLKATVIALVIIGILAIIVYIIK
jgi:hypothetical protein